MTFIKFFPQKAPAPLEAHNKLHKAAFKQLCKNIVGVLIAGVKPENQQKAIDSLVCTSIDTLVQAGANRTAALQQLEADANSKVIEHRKKGNASKVLAYQEMANCAARLRMPADQRAGPPKDSAANRSREESQYDGPKIPPRGAFSPRDLNAKRFDAVFDAPRRAAKGAAKNQKTPPHVPSPQGMGLADVAREMDGRVTDMANAISRIFSYRDDPDSLASALYPIGGRGEADYRVLKGHLREILNAMNGSGFDSTTDLNDRVVIAKIALEEHLSRGELSRDVKDRVIVLCGILSDYSTMLEVASKSPRSASPVERKESPAKIAKPADGDLATVRSLIDELILVGMDPGEAAAAVLSNLTDVLSADPSKQAYIRYHNALLWLQQQGNLGIAAARRGADTAGGRSSPPAVAPPVANAVAARPQASVAARELMERHFANNDLFAQPVTGEGAVRTVFGAVNNVPGLAPGVTGYRAGLLAGCFKSYFNYVRDIQMAAMRARGETPKAVFDSRGYGAMMNARSVIESGRGGEFHEELQYARQVADTGLVWVRPVRMDGGHWTTLTVRKVGDQYEVSLYNPTGAHQNRELLDSNSRDAGILADVFVRANNLKSEQVRHEGFMLGSQTADMACGLWVFDVYEQFAETGSYDPRRYNNQASAVEAGTREAHLSDRLVAHMRLSGPGPDPISEKAVALKVAEIRRGRIAHAALKTVELREGRQPGESAKNYFERSIESLRAKYRATGNNDVLQYLDHLWSMVDSKQYSVLMAMFDPKTFLFEGRGRAYAELERDRFLSIIKSGAQDVIREDHEETAGRESAMAFGQRLFRVANDSNIGAPEKKRQFKQVVAEFFREHPNLSDKKKLQLLLNVIGDPEDPADFAEKYEARQLLQEVISEAEPKMR